VHANSKTCSICFVVLMILCLYVKSSIIYGAGTDPSSFLSFGSNARAFALGGAYTGIAEDVSAPYYNSGALGALQYKEMLASYSILWEETNYSFLGYVHPAYNKGVFGFNFVRLYSGGAQGRDDNNLPTGSFDHSKMALCFAYGKELIPKVYFGINGKILNSTLSTSNINYFSFDIGGYYKMNQKLSLGTNISNLISLQLGDTDDKLPVSIKLGLGYRIFGDKLLLAFDMNKNSMNSGSLIDYYSVGLESLVYKFIKLRLGKNNQELTTGFGITYKTMGFDYAIAMNDYLGPSHRLSYAYKFGESLETIKLKKEEEAKEKVVEAENDMDAEARQLKEDKFKMLYQEAIQDYNRGMFSTAYEKFTKASELFPDDSLIPLYIERLKTVTEVISQYMSPGKEGDLVRRGVSYYVDGDGKNAVKTIAYALSIVPENFTIERLLNRLEEKTSIKAEKVSPMAGLTVVDQKLYECLISFRKRDFWTAISICEQILVLEPENVAALKRMGSAFYALGEKEKAKEIWRKSLNIQPDPKLEEFIRKMK